MNIEQEIAGVQQKNAVQDERLDQHAALLKALGAEVSALKRLMYVALGVMLGLSPATVQAILEQLAKG